MDFVESYSHNFAEITLSDIDALQVVRRSIYAPNINIYKGMSKEIKLHIEDYLTARGWISNFKVDSIQKPTIGFFEHKTQVAYQIQTGNIARAFYDLMKIQAIFENGRCKCGVLCLPSKLAAQQLGSNIANFDRIREELEHIFGKQISVPILLLSFE